MSAKKIQEQLQDAILEEIKKLSTDSLKKKLLVVNKIEGERNELEEKGYLKKYNDLKMTYEQKYQEYYEQIAKIVKGESTAEISAEDQTKYGVTAEESKETGIPQYWQRVFINSKFLIVNENDEEILKHLKDVTLSLTEDKLDFTINFHFEANDYFEQTLLTKTYIYDTTTYEPTKATSTVPTWKDGKNPTIKTKTKKIKKGKSIETKKIEETVPSFFDIFAGDENNEDGSSDIVPQADFIRDDLMCNSMEYFLDIYESDEYSQCDSDEEDEEGEHQHTHKKKKEEKKNEKCKNQ